MSKLTGKQHRFLRAEGHHLQPVVLLGKDGLTDGVVGSVDQALLDHELIKVKIGNNCLEDKKDVASKLETALGCYCVQTLGNILLMYRPHPEHPELRLPR